MKFYANGFGHTTNMAAMVKTLLKSSRGTRRLMTLGLGIKQWL